MDQEINLGLSVTLEHVPSTKEVHQGLRVLVSRDGSMVETLEDLAGLESACFELSGGGQYVAPEGEVVRPPRTVAEFEVTEEWLETFAAESGTPALPSVHDVIQRAIPADWRVKSVSRMVWKRPHVIKKLRGPKRPKMLSQDQ